jgi:hypothetical protein
VPPFYELGPHTDTAIKKRADLDPSSVASAGSFSPDYPVLKLEQRKQKKAGEEARGVFTGRVHPLAPSRVLVIMRGIEKLLNCAG